MLETGLATTSLNNKFRLLYVIRYCKLVIQTGSWYSFMKIVSIDSFCNYFYFYFYVHRCFTCMYVYVRASDLGVTDSLSYLVGAGN